MKSCFTVSNSLFFFLNFLCVYTRSSESAPTYLRQYCSSTLFTPNSTYRSNLDTLLSSLSSAATNSTFGFASATAGQNPPDQAYGLFLCRGDVSTAMCRDCVFTGRQDILQGCPNHRVSVIWYEECMLRYSNESIFSVMEETPAFTLYNTGNISNPAEFVQVLGDTIADAAWNAPDGDSRKKVAVATANFTSLETLYTFAQCTPDLSKWNCNTCLRSVIPGLSEVKRGGRMVTPSCNVRFELYPFYNASALLAPPPPPVTIPEGPLPPVTTPEGKSDKAEKSNKSAVIAVAITVPVGGALVLLFLTSCFLRRKGKKTNANEAVEGISAKAEARMSLEAKC